MVLGKRLDVSRVELDANSKYTPEAQKLVEEYNAAGRALKKVIEGGWLVKLSVLLPLRGDRGRAGGWVGSDVRAKNLLWPWNLTRQVGVS